MSMDLQVRAYLDQLAAAGGTPYERMSPEQARATFQRVAAARRGPDYTPEPVASVEDRTVPAELGDIPVRVYTPLGADSPAPVVPYFHGGGWVIGDLDTHDAHARAVCARAGAVVVSVDYRLAPEHPYPAALDDCDAVTRWAAEHGGDVGGDPRRLGVAGDSAGGNLAAAVTLLARERGGPQIVAQLLVYPTVDPSMRFPSVQENGNGYGLDATTMRWYLDHYLPDPGQWSDPHAAPLAADDLSGLPPAVVAIAGYDVLRDEGEAYAERLRAAGVPVTLLRHGSLIHGFFGMGASIDAANAAVDETCAAFASLLAG